MSELTSFSDKAVSDVIEKEDFELPPDKDVIFYNDNITTMDFVTDILISVYNKTREDATQLMLTVHNNGSAVIGTYTFDIAVSRVRLTREIAKKNGFPLRVEIE